MDDVIVIMCTPFDGWGETYIWSIYRNYDNAMAEMKDLIKKYNLEKGLFDNCYVNHSYEEPTIKNHYYKFEVKGYWFED